MSFLSNNNLRLFSRNEGKIKRYESCCDIRAWSHDLQVRDKYLREWIKCDMPICVIPISTLTSLLRTMTCKSRGRATPRCHPDCKSKILLESICASCQAMKECLKHNENMGKYFEEEEFETSHWPCERCLEALKSIKMFWKILIDKIFNINISKEAAFDNCNNYRRVDSVKTLAKNWHDEIIDQTFIINKVSPLFNRKNGIKQTRHPIDKSMNTDCISKSSITKTNKKLVRKISRSTSVRIQMADVMCDSCSLEKVNEEIKAYRANVKYLQDNYNRQKNEMERLRQENTTLKTDLKKTFNYGQWKPYCIPADMSSDDGKVALISKPLDTCVEENVHVNSTKETESEVIITMKNCKNENFKHVSLLQVLHKTNASVPNEYNTDEPSCNNQNPIDLLTRVNKTFGEIVRKELSIAGDRRHRNKKFDIEATFHRVVGVSQSMPSCSTESNISINSLSVSAKDVLSL